jgi:hypothetical protein
MSIGKICLLLPQEIIDKIGYLAHRFSVEEKKDISRSVAMTRLLEEFFNKIDAIEDEYKKEHGSVLNLNLYFRKRGRKKKDG